MQVALLHRDTLINTHAGAMLCTTAPLDGKQKSARGQELSLLGRKMQSFKWPVYPTEAVLQPEWDPNSCSGIPAFPVCRGVWFSADLKDSPPTVK